MTVLTGPRDVCLQTVTSTLLLRLDVGRSDEVATATLDADALAAIYSGFSQ
jgi:hypothetical protein